MALTSEQQQLILVRARMAAVQRKITRVIHAQPGLEEISEEWLLRDPVRVISVCGRLTICYRPDLVAAMSSDFAAMQAVLRSYEEMRWDEEARVGRRVGVA